MAQLPRRRWVLLSALVLPTLLAGILVWSPGGDGCLSEANVARLEPGMSVDQATDILGHQYFKAVRRDPNGRHYDTIYFWENLSLRLILYTDECGFLDDIDFSKKPMRERAQNLWRDIFKTNPPF